MSSLPKILRMISILSSKRKVKVKYLSQELGVTERQVGRYKTELDEYFDIRSITGPDGGYELKGNFFSYKGRLTPSEVDKIQMIIASLSYENSEELSQIIDKLNFGISSKNEETLFSEEIIPYSKPNTSIQHINKIHDDIYKAIRENKEVIVTYLDNQSVISERRVQPYKYLKYKGEHYLVAFCLLRNEIRFFKLVRIKEYIITGINFVRKFDIDNYLDKCKKSSIGIYAGELIKIELEIAPPMANTIKERVWVEDQEIVQMDKGIILFRATISESPELLSWIMSLGESVTILSPENIKEKVKKKIERMLEKLNL
ncbi:helix-turn-helix transcriptional regulator [Clostridium vincentii]|uniref:Uncharacterized protein n=1 Tax=Clostridium vincentii TaxID=52704 RepID=A0A2T0BFH8_9CLOT|nr:WYL domain-containing protein [Clostridium vincentii]PRR82651.1 hypothetical protein CLVI_16180 [Clostridium vincentii]